MCVARLKKAWMWRWQTFRYATIENLLYEEGAPCQAAPWPPLLADTKNGAKQTAQNLFSCEMNLRGTYIFTERLPFMQSERNETVSVLTMSSCSPPLCTICHWMTGRTPPLNTAGHSIFKEEEKKGPLPTNHSVTGLVRMPSEKPQEGKKKKENPWHVYGKKQRLEWQNNSPLIKPVTQRSLYSSRLHVKINVDWRYKAAAATRGSRKINAEQKDPATEEMGLR